MTQPLGARAEAPPGALPTPAFVVKDAGEAADYDAAGALTDAALQGAAFEAFVAKYPKSRVAGEALEKAMAAYLVARDLDKVDALSRRVLARDPDNARALAMAVFVLRSRAATASATQTASGAAGLAEQAGAEAERGLAALGRWRAEDGASPANAAAVRSEMVAIFNGALGYRALARKDYADAKTRYLAAVKADPSDLDDVYQLSVALLKATPLDPAGFWWAARAEDLAVTAGDHDAQTAIETYAKARYDHYHGGDEGWDALLSAAQTGLAPPADFAIAPAPSAAAVAVQAIRDSPVSSLSFADWEFILAQRDASPENRAAADKVWANIAALQDRGLRMKFQVKVIAVTPQGLDGAITDDNQQSGHADLRVKLEAPFSAPPQAGSTLSVTGLLTGYAPTPFAFTLEQARIVAPD